MSVPKFKRKPSGLDYVDNAYNLQVEIMNLSTVCTNGVANKTKE